MSTASDAEISTKEAAKLLTITPAWVRQVSQQGYFAPIAKDRWRLVDVVQGYIKYMRDEGRRTSKSAGDTRVRDARAADIELRTAERMRRLVPIDEALGVNDDVIGFCRTELAGIGTRLTRDLVLRNQVETEIDECLGRVADRLAKLGSALRSGSAAHAAGRPFNT